MNRRRLLRWTAALLVVGGLGAGAYFALWRTRRVQAAASLPTAPARKGDFAEIVGCRGDIGARKSVQLSAPRNIPDLRIVWQAEPGGSIKAGDVVVRFDASGARRQLAEQSAALKQAKASIAQAYAQARMTGEQDKLDLANARYEVERAKLEASKQAIVSVLKGEETRIDLATAEAKLRVQEATIELHQKSDESKTASLKRQLEKAQADVDLTTQRISQTEMRAPGDGIIVYLTNFSQGWANRRPFKVGDQVWPGAAVAEIPDTSTLQMECKVEEVDRGRIAAGNEARVHVDALPEESLESKVASISVLTRISFEWPPQRTFVAYAPIDKADARLRPGMNGGADIVVRHIPGAISVPAKAIFTRNGRPVVYVAEAKRPRAVSIEVLARNPDEVAVRGISAGASVCLVEPPAEGERQ
jgi:multidrug efflux pump subunit AcrA (membrane-fusion protein)